ncbi:MAG: glycosyltransferase [Paludibacter sp.]|nr:glycosyltransferase [Paludibacter sp.]
MNNRLILLTDSFPYEVGETFLSNEMPYLSTGFNYVHIFALYGKGVPRQQAENVTVHKPFLNIHPKQQKLKLLVVGLFNLSPCWFAVEDFFARKVYKRLSHLRMWLAATLIFRAAYSNKKQFKMLSSLSADNQTVVYSYWGDKLAFLIPFLKKNNPSVKSIARFHGGDLYETRRNGYIPFRKFLLPKLDCLAPVSLDGKQYLIDTYSFIIKNKIQIHRLGVFDNGLNPQWKTDNFFHLLSCSNMIPLKRIHLIVKALQFIDFDIKWTHIGGGILYDTIQNETKNLPKNIAVNLTGTLSNNEVLNFYRHNHIDLFINVSISEGVPVSIMEALSFGVPVVATDVGGSREIVDNSAGKLLDVNVSAQDIAEIIKFFSNCRILEFRTNARNRWAERCDAEKEYSKFVEFLNRF